MNIEAYVSDPLFWLLVGTVVALITTIGQVINITRRGNAKTKAAKVAERALEAAIAEAIGTDEYQYETKLCFGNTTMYLVNFINPERELVATKVVYDKRSAKVTFIQGYSKAGVKADI